MTPPIPAADEKERLRPLLGRIWRDYLSHHRTPLFLSIACAAVVGVIANLALWFAGHVLFPTFDTSVPGWGFDWRAEEAALNAFPQFRTNLHGIDLHFLHVMMLAAFFNGLWRNKLLRL